jgi:transcriptional regulator with XRE-family HTH domain
MNFRELRQQRGLSQEALAAEAGVQQVTISQIELGKVRDPRWSTVIRLATALEVSPHRIAQAIQDTEAA